MQTGFHIDEDEDEKDENLNGDILEPNGKGISSASIFTQKPILTDSKPKASAALGSDGSKIAIISSSALHMEEEEDEEIDEPVISNNNRSDRAMQGLLSDTHTKPARIVGDGAISRYKVPIKTYRSQQISDRFTDAQNRIKRDNWDMDAWSVLHQEAKVFLNSSRNRNDEAYLDGSNSAAVITYIDVLRQMVKQFSRSGALWSEFVEHTSNAKCKGLDLSVLDLTELPPIEKALVSCAHVELWRAYIRKIRRENLYDDTLSSDVNFLKRRDEVMQAFHKALSYMRLSPFSGPIWDDVVAFIKEWPEATSSDRSAKLSALKSELRSSLVSPTDNIERLWEEFQNVSSSDQPSSGQSDDAFGGRKSGGVVGAVVGSTMSTAGIDRDLPERYAATRAIVRERRGIIQRIMRSWLARPSKNSLDEIGQLSSWKALVAFDSVNPDFLTADMHVERMRHLYQACLAHFNYHPEIWIEFAQFEAVRGEHDKARKIYQEALESFLPDSLLLHLSWSEMEEQLENFVQAKDLLKKFAFKYPSAASFAALERLVRRVDGCDAARHVFVSSRRWRESSQSRLDSSIAKQTMTDSNTRPISFQYSIFHADMESRMNHNHEAARRVLELALFEDSANKLVTKLDFVFIYADILQRLGDSRNLRSLFERAISVSSSLNRAQLLWDSYVRRETEMCSSPLSSLVYLFQRRSGELDRFSSNRSRIDVNPTTDDSDDGISMGELQSCGFYNISEEKSSSLFQTCVRVFERAIVSGVAFSRCDADLMFMERFMKERRTFRSSGSHIRREENTTESGPSNKKKIMPSNKDSGGSKQKKEDVAADDDGSKEKRPHDGGGMKLAGRLSEVRLIPEVVLLLKLLPEHRGPIPDIETALISLSKTPLPPKPQEMWNLSDDNVQATSEDEFRRRKRKRRQDDV